DAPTGAEGEEQNCEIKQQAGYTSLRRELSIDVMRLFPLGTLMFFLRLLFGDSAKVAHADTEDGMFQRHSETVLEEQFAQSRGCGRGAYDTNGVGFHDLIGEHGRVS